MIWKKLFIAPRMWLSCPTSQASKSYLLIHFSFCSLQYLIQKGQKWELAATFLQYNIPPKHFTLLNSGHLQIQSYTNALWSLMKSLLWSNFSSGKYSDLCLWGAQDLNLLKGTSDMSAQKSFRIVHGMPSSVLSGKNLHLGHMIETDGVGRNMEKSIVRGICWRNSMLKWWARPGSQPE